MERLIIVISNFCVKLLGSFGTLKDHKSTILNNPLRMDEL